MAHNSDLGVFFISGAGLDGSIWDEVAAGLDLPYAVADHRASRQAQTSLKGYVDDDEQQILAMAVSRVVIVSHSIGGVIGAELLKRLGTRARGFVGISAAIPAPGRSFVSSLPFPQNVVTGLIMKLAGTKPPEAVIRKSLASDLTTTQADKIVQDFAPESVALYTDNSSSEAIPQVKALYVQTTNDKQFSVAQQVKMAARLDNCAIKTVVSGHLAMISHSEEVSAMLRDFVASL